MKRPDYQRAQEILHEALRAMVRDCLDPKDWTSFLAVTQASVSAVIAECIDSGTLLEPGGIDRVVAASTDMLREFLRGYLASRRDREAREARH